MDRTVIMKRRCLLVFVKSPDAKEVKSRLARSIGGNHARELYRCFVSDLLDGMDLGNFGLNIFFHPPDGERAVKAWLGENRIYTVQEGNELGGRMEAAFEKSLAQDCEAAVLIGSDFPDLPAEMIERAFDSLKSHDAVIGPALDGGYYLIGFNRYSFLPDAFAGIPWGADSVFHDTCTILERKGLRFSVLPPWRDIDTYEDLLALIEYHRDTPFAQSKTMQYALSHLLVTTDTHQHADKIRLNIIK